jgi:protein-S-isoprenylcysteine O-methyltransferase Ste14
MEEADAICAFGDDYREYMKTTGMFLPLLCRGCKRLNAER